MANGNEGTMCVAIAGKGITKYTIRGQYLYVRPGGGHASDYCEIQTGELYTPEQDCNVGLYMPPYMLTYESTVYICRT
jgi:hypothetical protein